MKKYLFMILFTVELSFLVCLIGCQGGITNPDISTTVKTPSATQEDTSGKDQYLDQRQKMVHIIQAYGVENEHVIRAMGTVPRHAFVPDDYLSQAYADHPLPIGYGQTISQPYIVAWMTDLLELNPGDIVLEIGTGSGYQAAILAELGYVEVYSIEIVPELAQSAAARLQKLGYEQIYLKEGDGYYGWEEFAPYDAIIVTAAPDHLPAPLVSQLAPGGCIVIPIGPPGGYQTLWRFVNEKNGLKAYNMGGVRFVPFTGGGAAQSDGAPWPLR